MIQTDKKTILITDDDPTFRLILRKFLELEGYHTIEAEDGAAALALFHACQPDCILMDAKMPVMDGFEACRQIRALPEGASLPLIMMTALSDDQAVDLCYEVGASDYVNKPIHLVALRHRVYNLIDKYLVDMRVIASEKQYRTLFESSRDALLILDESRFVDGNEAAMRMFGYDLSDNFKPMHPAELSPPTQPCGTDSMTLANKRIATALKDGSVQFEWMHQRLNGEVFPAEVLLAALEIDGKKVLQATVRDITGRKRTEQTLIKSETLHREIMQSAFDAIIISDRTGMVLEANAAAVGIFGYAPETWKGLEITALIPEHLRHRHDDGFRKFTDSGTCSLVARCIQTEALHQDGHTFPIELCLCELNNGQNKVMATIRDITERKKAEDALREVQARYEDAQTIAQLGHWVLAMDKNELAWSDQVYRIFELDPKNFDASYDAFFDIVHPDDRELVKNAYENSVKNKSSYDIEHRLLMKDGRVKWVNERCKTDYDEDDKPLRSIGTVLDITERKKADESVRKLSSAIKHAGESILITDRNGIIEYVNPAFTQITGYNAEDAMGQTPRLLNSGNQDEAFYAEMWDTITSGKVWHGKVIDRRKDGSFYPAMLTISPIFDDSGIATHYTHFIGIQSDLSVLEDMENRFHQAQKMEAVGTMVGGIAHNFNNMLAGMTGNLYLAKKRVQAQPDVVQRLANVEELSLHAAEMIQQLLAFARKGVVSIKEMPLTPFISETLKLLHASVPENITVHQNVCTDDLIIKGDGTQLHQVLVNLVNNARDAVEGVDKPCITIKLEPFQVDDAFIEKHPYFKAGAYARLCVADNGTGISERHIEHLFEPFFTTKEQGQGTGLGLSMVYGAVKTHHGFVEVESSSGEGSTFHIYIPLLETKDKAVKTEQKLEAAVGQGELILLADDEPVIREVMAEVLESIGYRVIMAADGLEAFELFKAHEQDIAIALLDLIMPRMGGAQLAGQIRAMKPELPVIFLTGYDKEHVLNGNEKIQLSETFTKPVNFDALSHSIRKMLD